MIRKWSALCLLLAIAALPAHAAAPSIRVMILDGESAGTFHDWARTTPVLRRQLQQTGLFQVDVVTAPPAGADFSAFHPDFSRYGAVVLNYDAPDGRWPADLKDSFEQYVKSGGGLVIVHAADNAFPGWPAFNEMTGIGGWRGRNAGTGPYWYMREGKLISDPSPGVSGSHGRRIPFAIKVETDHPITRGLPKAWLHQADELYAHLRGPGKNLTVLASAWSDPANAGSGRDEPQLMVLPYGKGRVFHTTLGHDVTGMSSVDFVVTFQRGVEWAATGSVLQQVPADFPSTDAVRVRADMVGEP